LSSCPGCCPLLSASSSRRRTGSGWRPTGPVPEPMGAVRDGSALLAGLLACGRCSAKMTVHC
jgi:hypothetical protein